MIGPSTRLSQTVSHAAPRIDLGHPGTAGRVPGAGVQGAGVPGDGAARRAVEAQDGDGAANRAVAAPSTSGDLCRLLALLADKTRLRILRILANGEQPVVGLTTLLRLPQPTVSHHLAWLRMMDLVSPRRQGKHVFYALGAAAACDDKGTLTLTANDATVTITPNPEG